MTGFVPLDMRCGEEGCGAAPGERCVWLDQGVARPRRPHAVRVTAAREATAYANRSRSGSRP